MKSQFRCILFALIAVPAACGGDRSTQATSSGDSLVAKQAVTPTVPSDSKPEPAPSPAKVEPARPEPAEPAAPTTYSETLAQGKAAAASGDHARARELFEAASKLDKKAAEPHLELSRLFITMGERHLAITAANKAVKLAGSSQAYNTLGRAELARFSYDDAMVAFHKAIELNPDNVWAWNNLGLAHLQLKHYQEASEALAEATSRKGAEGYMWNNLGTACEQLGQLDDARTAYENGGKLGSREALASRKRLEGVKTIVVMKTEKPSTRPAGAKGTDTGYDLAEPMPDVESTEPAKAMSEPTEPAEANDADSVEPDDTKADAPTGDASKPMPGVAPAPSPAEKPAAPSPL